jgi:hypothetical protein
LKKKEYTREGVYLAKYRARIIEENSEINKLSGFVIKPYSEYKPEYFEKMEEVTTQCLYVHQLQEYYYNNGIDGIDFTVLL